MSSFCSFSFYLRDAWFLMLGPSEFSEAAKQREHVSEPAGGQAAAPAELPGLASLLCSTLAEEERCAGQAGGRGRGNLLADN